MDNRPFDRFNDKPPRRERREADSRFSRRGDRFGSKPRRFFDEDRFEDRDDRFGGRRERFSDDARQDRRFSDRKPGFGRPPRCDFGSQSGPRARAFDRRRFTDRAAFVKTATVRLDPDVAEFFHSAEAVNTALRGLVDLAKLLTPQEEHPFRKEAEETHSVPEDSSVEEAGKETVNQEEMAESQE